MERFEFNTKLKKGDPEAFSQLFKQIHSRLLNYCRLFIQDIDLCEDFVQESFIQLWEKHETIIPDKSVESFLFVIVRNKCFSYLKEKRILDSDISYESIPVNELQYLYQLDFLQKEELSIEESLFESLKNAIESLPEKRKKVFIASKIEGVKQRDIAEQFDISIKTVEKHLSEANKELRKKLQKEYFSSMVYYVLLSLLFKVGSFFQILLLS